MKWSYRKLIRWWVVLFLSIGWIVFYINTIAKNSAAVLSPPLTLFALLSVATLLLLRVLFWRHHFYLQASVFPVGTLVPLPTLAL